MKIQSDIDRKQNIVDIAKKRLKRSPDKYFETIAKIKAEIHEIHDYIDECFNDGDTIGIENLLEELKKLNEELSLWESVTS